MAETTRFELVDALYIGCIVDSWFKPLTQVSKLGFSELLRISIPGKPQTLSLYVGCVLIPKNILGTLFRLVALILEFWWTDWESNPNLLCARQKC